MRTKAASSGSKTVSRLRDLLVYRRHAVTLHAAAGFPTSELPGRDDSVAEGPEGAEGPLLPSTLEEILRHAFYRDERNSSLPPPHDLSYGELPPEYAAVEDDRSRYLRLYPLRDDAEWETFHRAFAGARGDNLKPWFRCLGILRGSGAQLAVLERHYVCLDYRSEFASFYAHLDAPRRNSTIRLHFFSQRIEEDELFELTDQQRASYLGYMVLREGDLPLVGRTVLATPSYVDVSTAINEPVNFFAQRLVVTGVPFMQQDQRFAVCAHISAWVTHYSAFRRGIFERRLIADFVNLASSFTPMRPRHAGGLTVSQLSTLLDEVGFRSLAFFTPLGAIGEMPPISAAEVPDVVPFLPPDAVDLPDPDDEPAGLLSQTWRTAEVAAPAEEAFQEYLEAEETARSGREGGSAGDYVQHPHHNINAVRAVERVLAYVIQPHVESGWPVYAGMENHAVTICGRAHISDHQLHVIHDDQHGPYMLAPSLTFLSRDCLRHQSGRYVDAGQSELASVPPSDVVLAHPQAVLGIDAEPDLAVHALVVPLPPRVLLQPTSARRRALGNIGRLLDVPEFRSGVDSDRLVELRRAATRVTLLMGIDYKTIRRRYARDQTDSPAVKFFSMLHVAEWVIVVEGLSQNGETSIWEFVFDGSSSQDDPRLQMGRVFDVVLGGNPKGGAPSGPLQLHTDRLPVIERPQTFQKWKP